MKYYWLLSLTSVQVGLLLAGCAGPTTPFGALEVGSGDGYGYSQSQDAAEQATSGMSVTPKRQMLHKSSPLKIEVNIEGGGFKSMPGDAELQVTYNKRNVTNAFRRNSVEEKLGGQQHLSYVYKNLRLKPDRHHDIDLYMVANNRILSHQKFLPPECSMGVPRAIASTEPFSPPSRYLDSINKFSKENLLNPTFLAGLIAQESGFDFRLVSWAKGIGLTQVTPLADDELKRLRPLWKRDPRIQILGPSAIEDLIEDKKLSKTNDWRLNPDLAVEGGALYLNYLREYWSGSENQQLLRTHPKIKFEEVVLASYNSGAARVKLRIQKYGNQWLEDEDLKEAYKYVNNVRSYCYHFSEDAQ